MNRLQDRVALITGAGAGIGKGVARRFAAEGASLWLADINAETCARAAVMRGMLANSTSSGYRRNAKP